MNDPAERSTPPGQWLEHQAAGSIIPRPAGQDEQFDWQACWANFRGIHCHREPAQPPVIDMKRTT
jgi:hypothetical protein